MQQYGIEFYTRLAQTCGHDIGYGASGIVYLYLTTAGWDSVQPYIAQARQYGTLLEILTQQRAQEVVPQIRSETTVGTIFDPQSIRLRAADAIRALVLRFIIDVTVFGHPIQLSNGGQAIASNFTSIEKSISYGTITLFLLMSTTTQRRQHNHDSFVKSPSDPSGLRHLALSGV